MKCVQKMVLNMTDKQLQPVQKLKFEKKKKKREMAAFNTKLFSSKEIIDQIDMEVQQGCQYRLFSQFL